MMEQQLGLCFQFIRSKYRTYGLRQPNGSWTGLIGTLQRQVWLGVFLVSLIVFGVSQAVFCGTDLVHEIWREEAPVAGSGRIWQSLKSVERSALWTWPVLLSQSVPWVPSGGLARGVAGLWLLMSFILGSVYRSNLKAMLIYPRVHLPFSNLEELADSNILMALANGSVVHRQIMSADKSSSLGKLGDQLFLHYADQTHSIAPNIYKGKYGVITFTSVLLGGMHNYFSMIGECATYIMPRGFLGPKTLSLAFPKGSRLRQSIDRIIISLRESGILAKLFSDGTINATECAAPVGSSLSIPTQRPLQLKDFYGVFLLCAVGLLLAAEVFFNELFIFRYIPNGKFRHQRATLDVAALTPSQTLQ